MSLKREDLRRWRSVQGVESPARRILVEVTDDELRELGYIKLGSLIGKSWCEAHGYVKLDVDVELDAHQIIGSCAPFWNLTDWEEEGHPDWQADPKAIINEAWETINYLADKYDALRRQVLAALDGETT